MCVQPSVWYRHRKWALLNHTTFVQFSRLSWYQNHRENPPVAMGCSPHGRNELVSYIFPEHTTKS
jgi:hypothetical protein